MKRVVGSTICFFGVLVAYWLYALLIVPWIEPPIRSAAQVGSIPPFDPSGGRVNELREEFEHLFSPDSFELHDPKVVRTRQGTLLVKNIKPQPDGSVVLDPCTLVIKPSGQEKRREVVIQSPEGAVLRFDPPLNLSTGKIGRLVGGRMSGKVTVRSPETAPGAKDALRITTSNLQIHPDRIWTPNEVDFQMGRSHGRGRDLSILLRSKSDAIRGQSLESSRVKLLRLNQVDRVHLFVQGNAFGESKPDSTDEDTETELQVTCQGPFEFDFERRTAVLNQKVDVIRHNPVGAADQLNCDRLTLSFSQDEGSAEATSGDSSRGMSGMKIQQMVAEGFPVILRAPSLEATVRGKRLEYDFPTRVIQLKDDEEVVMEYAPRKLKIVGRHVVLQPDGDFQVLSVISAATVSTPDAGVVQAERIDVWLAETKLVEDGRTKETMRPVRMLAQDNARLNSPQFLGRTGRLEVWIRYAEPATTARVEKDRKQGPERLSKSLAPRKKKPAERPDDLKDKSRFELTGGIVKVQLLNQGKETFVQDVTVEQQVQLRQLQSDLGEEPLQINGDLLRLLHGDTPEMEVFVVGRPAKVRARGTEMTGGHIQLRRATNQVTIDGPGTMTSLAKQPALPPSVVEWQGSMQFDGRTAHFQRDIQVRGAHRVKSGETLFLTTRGQQLDVTLDRKIDFSKAKDAQQRELYSFVFTGQVFLENTTYSGQERKSWERMLVRNLFVNHKTGEMASEREGWLQSVHLGNALNEKEGQATVANGPNEPVKKSTIKFLRVDFDNGMQGNVIDRWLRFSNNVRTLYGPVAGWEQEIKARTRDDLGEHGVLMTSERLDVLQMGPQTQDDIPVELVAQDNVIVEGLKFAARAARVSYVRNKDLLVLEGDGRADAQLWLSNQAAPDATARRLLFSRRNNRIQAGDFRYVDLSRLGVARNQQAPRSTRENQRPSQNARTGRGDGRR